MTEQTITLQTKGPSLIGQGWIDPTDREVLPIALQDVAQVLKISVMGIESDSLERWPHMLRVKLTNGQFHCASYRALPGWAIAGEKAIRRCTTLEELDEFAVQVNAEKQRFKTRYPEATLEHWRKIWAQQRQILRARAHLRQQEQQCQQAAIDWKWSWYWISRHCQNRDSFQGLWKEWQQQSTQFAHLPEIIGETETILKQRWQELSQVS